MTKIASRKLALRKECLRRLSAVDLQAVAGGLNFCAEAVAEAWYNTNDVAAGGGPRVMPDPNSVRP